MDIAILTSIRLFGDGLASFLNTRQDTTVVVVAQNFSALFEAMTQSKIDLALVDVTQGIDVEIIRTLASNYPTVTLLAIGLSANQKEIVRCGRAGFAGYVFRDASLNQLMNAIENAITGKLSCSPEIAGELLRALYYEATSLHSQPREEALTPRECEVLRELGNGRSNKEIARQLDLSISTVKHHVHKILEKLQVARRAEAMRHVRNMPWIVGNSSTMVKDIN